MGPLPPCDLSPEEIEVKVRGGLAGTLDDREVAWQVANAISMGRVVFFYDTCRAQPRCEGPATFEVHEWDERWAREWPSIMRQVTVGLREVCRAHLGAEVTCLA